MNTTLEARTIPELLIASAERWPDQLAVGFPGLDWTFGELHRQALEVARGLIALGIRPRDHVGLLVPNGGDFMRAFFGAALAGAVVVPLNMRYRSAEISYVLGQSDVRAVVLSAVQRGHFDFEPVVQDVCAQGRAPKLEHVIVLGGEASEPSVGERHLAELAESVGDDVVAARARLAGLGHPGIMLYTSGTTAAPKAAVLSHEAVVRTGLAWGRESLGMSPDDVIWIPNPLFHVGALSTMIASIGSGSRFLSMPFFEPDGAVKTLSTEPVTLFFPVFDAVALPIIEHPDADQLNFERVRMSFVIGHPANVARIKAALPHSRHLNVYGMTETAGWCVLNFRDEGPDDPLAGGSPVPGVEFRIRALDRGAEAEVGELGAIHIRSWSTLSEYYRDPDATRKSIDADGWFDTGDLGIRTSEGDLRWRGRNGERMKVGGENVAPMEIEKHLAAHPGIRQCAVVGVPDSRLGEVPAAFVEVYPGIELSEQDVVTHCEGSIARFKVPRYVRFVKDGEWPMSTTKIRKPDLKASLIAELHLEGVTTPSNTSERSSNSPQSMLRT